MFLPVVFVTVRHFQVRWQLRNQLLPAGLVEATKLSVAQSQGNLVVLGILVAFMTLTSGRLAYVSCWICMLNSHLVVWEHHRWCRARYRAQLRA